MINMKKQVLMTLKLINKTLRKEFEILITINMKTNQTQARITILDFRDKPFFSQTSLRYFSYNFVAVNRLYSSGEACE